MKLCKGLGAVASAVIVGCGGGSGGTGGSGNTTCGTPGVPPCPTGSTTSVTTSHNYAIHRLYLGDLDPTSGKASPTAWQNYGYNLDGKDTTASSTDVCRQVLGATADEQTDGPNGIDNSFGENLLRIITDFETMPSATISTDINAGDFTVMTDITGFDDSAGSTANATGLSGVIMAGANMTDADAPNWSPTYEWTVSPELLDCGSNCAGVTNPAQHATVKLTNAYQSGGTFVSGAPTELSLRLAIEGQTINLNIVSAIITFQPKGPGHVQNGIIAGAIVTADFIGSIQNLVGYVANGAFCSGSALQAIENSISYASDVIVTGNTLSNTPGTTCNAITIGLGFDADEIAQPNAVAPAAPADQNPCTPMSAGGTEAGGD